MVTLSTLSVDSLVSVWLWSILSTLELGLTETDGAYVSDLPRVW